MPQEWVNEEQARQLRDEMLDGALPVVFAGPLVMVTDGVATTEPFIQIDVTGRPDVADIFRVIHGEGMQDRTDRPCRYVSCDGQGYMETTLELTDPVECSFKFVLLWPEQRDVFDLEIERGHVYLTTKNVEEGFGTQDVLGFKTPPELPQVLDRWQRLE